MHIFKMFLASTFLASGIVATFAPWLSDRVHTMIASATLAAQVETIVEVVVPIAVGLVAAFLAARRRRIQLAQG